MTATAEEIELLELLDPGPPLCTAPRHTEAPPVAVWWATWKSPMLCGCRPGDPVTDFYCQPCWEILTGGLMHCLNCGLKSTHPWRDWLVDWGRL